MVWAEFHRLEFVAVDGRVRTFYGCSVAGLFEFQDRLAELDQAIAEADGETPIVEMYLQRDRFRHACDRALILNGIQPEWVNPAMMVQMLFDRVENGEIIPAYLRELNRPYQSKRPIKGKPLTGKAGLIAAIAQHTGSIAEAYELAQTVPARELLAVMDERNEMNLKPEEREKLDFDDWAQQARSKARQRSAA